MPCIGGSNREAAEIMRTVRCLSSCTSLAVCLLFTTVATAQSFPSKPIRIIATATAGGGVDTSSRIVAQNFQDVLGQPGVVENRPGGGGAAGSDYVAKSPPDGHTLLTISISHAVLPSSHKNLPYSPERDLTPIAVMVNSPNILVAHPSLPVKSIKELIAYARKRPGEINYASSGSASPSHLATENLKLLARIDLTHVPYKGTAPGVTDLDCGTCLAHVHEHHLGPASHRIGQASRARNGGRQACGCGAGDSDDRRGRRPGIRGGRAGTRCSRPAACRVRRSSDSTRRSRKSSTRPT